MLVNYDSSTTFRPLISLKLALVVTALCELCSSFRDFPVVETIGLKKKIRV